MSRKLVALMPLLLAWACTSKEPANARAADSAPPAAPDVKTPDSATTSLTSPAQAGAVEYFRAADLDRVAQELSRGTTTGRTLSRSPTYSYLQIRRTQNGVPEVHDRWIDVTIVQSGHGTLLSGGQVTGSHPEPDGEHRGGTINGGTQRPVGPGDLMRIPAGVPHQYLIQRGDSLRYITIKILKS